MKTNEMKAVFVNDTMVSEEYLKEEVVYISNITDIPYDTVLCIIKGIDAYYYLMGMQDELTFDDCKMFIDDNIQPREYDSDCVIDDNEMFDFISSHTDISDGIIESVMIKDFEYQQSI